MPQRPIEVEGEAHPLILEREVTEPLHEFFRINQLEKVKCALRGVYHYDARCISVGGKKEIQYYINRYNPVLFCVNDNEKASEADRIAVREFLERRFPEKSSFEV